MRLTLREVGKLSRAIAAEHGGEIVVDGVAASHGDSESVELLLTVTRPGRAPRAAMVLVRRVDRETFERDFRRRIATQTRAS